MSVFRKLSVADNIRAVLELQDRTNRQIEDGSRNLMELGIHHRDNTAISLSGGSAALGRDRPRARHRPAPHPARRALRRVDPDRVLDIQKIIRFLKERGIGVLITDHNVRETLGICDRAYIINEGRVLASGAVRDHR